MLAAVVAVAVAGLGSQILGEYEFEGWLPFVAGPVLGVVVAEAVLTVGRWRDRTVALFCAATAALALLWAGRIDAAAGAEQVKPLVWVASALGAAGAYAWIEWPSIRDRVRR